jgi:Gly-Xaa carboxypeptidase
MHCRSGLTCRHEKAHVEHINTLGLIVTLEGTDPSLKPMVLCVH